MAVNLIKRGKSRHKEVSNKKSENKFCNEVKYYNISIMIIVANFYFHWGRKFHATTYDKKICSNRFWRRRPGKSDQDRILSCNNCLSFVTGFCGIPFIKVKPVTWLMHSSSYLPRYYKSPLNKTFQTIIPFRS